VSVFLPLRKEIVTYLPKDQVERIYKAYQFAAKAHQDQCRSSGENYITHPIAVAMILSRMRLDETTLIAAVLHDVLEDTKVSRVDLEKKFGKDVARLVDGVSKLTQIKFGSRAEAQAENFRKMLMAMADDVRVILIKLADRLHNMRTLESLPASKQKRIARETLDIYSPIANRLGMHSFRLELEAIGFAIFYPRRHRILRKAVQDACGNRQEIVAKIQAALEEVLQGSDLNNFRVVGREKHLYSLYKKMRNKHLKFSDVMDIYGFRIIVEDQSDCYRALGIVHGLYKPIPRRFKDYIAMPKANGYQSLHTVLFGPFGVPIEVQIRTNEMEKIADDGIAAHWVYKTDSYVTNQAQMHARDWIKGLLEIQRSAGDSLEFIENVKLDLFPGEVYVFTPQGQIVALPHGATPIDFAYKIHSDIGDHCMSVKIDRRISPLSARLQNGQTVEIIASPSAYPNPAWLHFVVTGKARIKIRQFLQQQRESESIKLGQRLLSNALLSHHVALEEIPKEHIDEVLESLNFGDINQLFGDIGLGNQVAQLVARQLINREEFKITRLSNEDEHKPLCIKGSEGVVLSFANCCHPIPDDPIEGVMTKGHGVTVHHANCKNLLEFHNHPEKRIMLCWEKDVHGEFEVELSVEIINLRGVLAEIALVISDEDANINNVGIYDKDEKYSIVKLLVMVRNREHLSRIMRHLQQLTKVTKVIRVQNI